MPDLAAAYDQTYASMTTLTEGLDEQERITRVPACPDWTVKDLIAHVTSIAASLAIGGYPEDLNPSAFWDNEMAIRREAFIDEALETRREKSLDEILSEWAQAREPLMEMMRGARPWPRSDVPMIDWILVTDIAVHHHDLRGALGAPGDRDSLATGLSLRSYIEGMRFRALVERLPGFTVVAGSRSWTIGDDPAATVTADPFELARAVSGRRSPEQVSAFDWDTDPEPYLPYFYPYGPRTESLSE